MPKTQQQRVWQTAKILAYIVMATMLARKFLVLPDKVMQGLGIAETYAMFGVALMCTLLAALFIKALFAGPADLPSSEQSPE
jgi:hypothetical protein